MSRSRLSLLGLYQWDNTLFDSMYLPEDWAGSTKNILINNILMECAELEVLYADGDFMKQAIATWSAKELPTWERLYAAMLLEYNPIENYNRTEDTNYQNFGKLTHSGKDTNQASGNDVDAKTGYDNVVGSGTDTDTEYKTTFDNNTFAATGKIERGRGATDTQNYNSTLTHTNGRKDEYTHGHAIEDKTGHKITSNISGNIGVTTSQQILEQELEVAPKLNVMNYIIDSFKNRFCLLVY